MLLGLRRKFTESGFSFERTLLLLRGEVSMTCHPLPQVWLPLALQPIRTAEAALSQWNAVRSRRTVVRNERSSRPSRLKTVRFIRLCRQQPEWCNKQAHAENRTGEGTDCCRSAHSFGQDASVERRNDLCVNLPTRVP